MMAEVPWSSVSISPRDLRSNRPSSNVGVVMVLVDAERNNPENALGFVFDPFTRKLGCESVVGGGAKKGIAMLGSLFSELGDERWRCRRIVRSALRRVSRV